MFKEQNYMCAICSVSQAVEGRKFAVDHCHKTGKVRGLLCQPCNTALGLFKENKTVLSKAFDYLTKGSM